MLSIKMSSEMGEWCKYQRVEIWIGRKKNSVEDSGQPKNNIKGMCVCVCNRESEREIAKLYLQEI